MKPTKKKTGASPAATFIRLAYEFTAASRTRTSHAIEAAVQAAIVGHMRFDENDFQRLHNHGTEGGIWLGRYLLENTRERWYSQAAAVGNTSALRALETWIGRPRYVCDGVVLHEGAQFRLPDAIHDDNRGGWVTVTSFSDDGKYLNLRPQNDESYVRCRACGQERRVTEDEPGTDKKRKRLRALGTELTKHEKARVKVLGMAFEQQMPEGQTPRLREFAGKLISEHAARADLQRLAKLKIGEEMTVQVNAETVTLRRITCLTHDILATEFGLNRRCYFTDKQKAPLVALGLLTRGTSQFGSIEDHIADAGRERLRALSNAADLEALDGIEGRRRQQEAQRQQAEEEAKARNAGRVQALLRSYSDEELATVVTRGDSLAARNCEIGTDSWIRRHAPGRTEMTVRELIELDGGQNTTNLQALIRIGLARVARRQGARRASREESD